MSIAVLLSIHTMTAHRSIRRGFHQRDEFPQGAGGLAMVGFGNPARPWVKTRFKLGSGKAKLQPPGDWAEIIGFGSATTGQQAVAGLKARRSALFPGEKAGQTLTVDNALIHVPDPWRSLGFPTGPDEGNAMQWQSRQFRTSRSVTTWLTSPAHRKQPKNTNHRKMLVRRPYTRLCGAKAAHSMDRAG
jgi:hypothetical protein